MAYESRRVACARAQRRSDHRDQQIRPRVLLDPHHHADLDAAVLLLLGIVQVLGSRLHGIFALIK